MKNKLKLYIYPAARFHIHDKDIYRGLVPLSADGIKEHCEIVTPEQADYFYMGQFSDNQPLPNEQDFPYFWDKPERHIADIEGDWYCREVPMWLRKAILTINGAKAEYNGLNMFVRPTFSRLLVNIKDYGRCFHSSILKPNRTLFFRGQSDPELIRHKMAEACKPLPSDITITDKWLAKIPPFSNDGMAFREGLLKYSFALCPAGHGVDSARFFEACYFGAIPIVISSLCEVPFEYAYRKPFYFKLDPNIEISKMTAELEGIQNADERLIRAFSLNCQEYFENYVRPYLNDPTACFIEWLRRV